MARGLEGLRGLPGLNRLSQDERNKFLTLNDDLLSPSHFSGPMERNQMAEILYNNSQYIKKYGEADFDNNDDGTLTSYNLRNQRLKKDIADEEFAKLWSPWSNPLTNSGKRDNRKGLGEMWDVYSEMSPDAKIKLIESNWTPQSELNKKWAQESKDFERVYHGTDNPLLHIGGLNQAMGTAISESNLEAERQRESEKNQKILDKIYNDDLKNKTNQLSDIVSQVYAQDNNSDDATKKRFYDIFVKDDSPMVKMKKGEYAAHINSDEMKNFSIDDMRKALAKWDTYTKYMSPYAAGEALNNEAKEYIVDNQSSWERAKAYIGDFAISTMSYTADKVNGFVNAGYALADLADGGVGVFVDNEGNPLDPKDVRTNNKGQSYYMGADGKAHLVRQRQMARTTLRNMGKNLDGSENHGFLWDGDPVSLNPQYWTKAEMYGTLNEEEQKQLEKYNASPHTVAYKPNEEGNFWWEVFKMGTFGLADMASSLIPVGGVFGLAGKGIQGLSKLSKTAGMFGNAMNRTGRFLMNNNQRIAQLTQGTAGALGIAYAYNRGAFQETLEKNLGNVEAALQDRSRRAVYERYENDDKYKASIDKQINAKYNELKALANAQNKETGAVVLDRKALDEQLKAQAQREVLETAIENEQKVRKNSLEYAQLQDKAIDEAGDAAFNTFWPEAIKYGLINTVGFRKWLYTNPTGLKTKLSSSLKGLKEVTTSAGRQRLAAETSKFLTRGDKWKQLAKTTSSQMLNGAWTNGTDDMMTDAAERMSSDSFDRYINGYLNDEAIADNASLTDGMYTFMRNLASYGRGLSNSLGQESTWNATAVGAFGSGLSGNLNFVNLGRLATRSGREAYRKTFQERYQRDDNGIIQRDEKGNPLTEKVGWRENWRDRAAYFIQNGILSTYYGKKQAERDLQSHADFVNQILDDSNDFEDITDLIASDKGLDEAVGTSDEKTMRFIKALKVAKTLANLGNSSTDPAKMSSVVQNAKALMEQAAQIEFDPERDNLPEDELTKSLINQYYANNENKDNPHNPYTDRKALATVIKNAQDFQKASEAYDNAEKEIQKAETSRGEEFSPIVRERLKLNHALNGHWEDRLSKMKDEIGDTSESGEIAEDNIIPSLGSRKNVQDLVKAYNRQEKEITSQVDKQTKTIETAKKNLDDATKALADNTDNDKTYDLQKKVVEEQAKYENEQLQLGYLRESLAATRSKRNKVENALKVPVEEGSKTKVLTADEIMALDPVSRARMLRNDDVFITDEDRKEGVRSWREKMYSPEQIAEIEKLERQLTMRDADALQKVQDIALLTQRIEANKDAYSKVMQNPEAAAVAFEAQRNAAAERGYSLINERNAKIIADFIKNADTKTKGFNDLSDAEKEGSVFRALRQYNQNLLDIIDNDNLLPQYQKQVDDAKSWRKAVDDLDAVITRTARDKEDGWEDNVRKNLDVVEQISTNADNLMSNLERVLNSDNQNLNDDVNTILQGLENLGYQRDATVIEERKQRQEREAKEKAEREAQETKEKALKDKVEKAAEEEAAKKGEIVVDGEGVEVDMDFGEEEKSAPKSEKKAEEKADKADEEDTENAEKAGIGVNVDIWSESDTQNNNAKASSLMADNVNEGSVDVGEIWHGGKENASKDMLNVILKKHGMTGEKLITFAVSGVPEFFNISPEDWKVSNDDPNGITQKQLDDFGLTKDTPFEISNLYSVNGHWYFDGAFDGRAKDFRVEVADNFNLGDFLNRQIASREAEYTVEGINTGNKNLVVGGDTVGSRSETVAEQKEEAEKIGEGQYFQVENVDNEKVNDITEASMNSNETTLSATAMQELVIFDKDNPDAPSLKKDGTIVHKKGSKEGDSMNRYFAWMNNAGINLQEIIDTELSKILEQNPHIKVKFMYVNPAGKGTDDEAMQTHLMLVVDYDDKVNKGITSIHNGDNGGVITANGKQYLVIGTAGYGNNMGKRNLYDILMSNNPRSPYGYGRILTESNKYFKEHSDERYYVNDDLTTEVVPQSLIPGYIARQLETDNNAEYRDITEILKDKARNPESFKLEDLVWGIQEESQFLIVNNKANRRILLPQNPERNMGRAFVFIPAANGALIPSYLKPLFYADVESNGNVMRDGKLKDEVMGYLNQLVAPDNKTRVEAIIGLSNIFYFDNEKGNGIITTKDTSKAPVVSLLHNGQIFKSFNLLDPNFDRQKLFDAFAEMNPRINITYSVLKNPERLAVYSEAGALQTDAAILHTVGASYSIYAVDADGNMLGEGKALENAPQTAPTNDDFRKDSRQVVFKGNLHVYRNGKYYLNGREITDAKTIKQLDYNRRIFVEQQLEPTESSGLWNTFILSKGEHPEVVKVHKNTYEVKELSEDEAKALIAKYDKKNDDKERQNAAEEALKDGEGIDVNLENETETPSAFEDNGEMIVDPDTGLVTTKNATKPVQEEKKEEKKPTPPKPTAPPKPSTPTTQSFKELQKNGKYGRKISMTIMMKWKDAPKNNDKLMDYLRKKGIEVDSIGTSEDDINTWIDTLKNCR